ncbi:MAG: PilZ domain-containing protein [Candidatus Omnitrophota bacterium]|nr:PilZ domain-containing protein [Candidatus Omnitrophota bacterium]
MERRKHKRVEVDAYVSATLTTNGAQAERIFTSKNIGPEGMFLVSNESFPTGTILNLRIHTPSTLEPINVEAKVIRVAKDENLRVIGMGLAFIKISENDQKELLKHLYLAFHYTGNK